MVVVAVAVMMPLGRKVLAGLVAVAQVAPEAHRETQPQVHQIQEVAVAAVALLTEVIILELVEVV